MTVDITLVRRRKIRVVSTWLQDSRTSKTFNNFTDKAFFCYDALVLNQQRYLHFIATVFFSGRNTRCPTYSFSIPPKHRHQAIA